MLRRGFVFACLAVCAVSIATQQLPPLKLDRAIPLPGVEGRIDHLAADLTAQRVYISALGSDEVEVVDLREGRRVARIEGLHEPQGILYVPARQAVYVANGDDGTVRSYDARTLAHLKTVALGEDADNLRFDPVHNQVLAAYGAGAIAVLSLDLTRIRDLRLPAHPEAFALTPDAQQIFVNLPGNGSIGHIDLNTMAVNPDWVEPSANGNFPMALDAADHRLLVACRDPGVLLLIDTASGQVLDRMATVGDADDLFFDSDSKTAFVIGAEGYVDVVRVASHRLTSTAHVTTASGARTGLWVPQWKRLLVAAPRRGTTPARLLIYSLPTP
ncbi:MAG: YncE family protein [Acidobacteriota bacterium]